MSLRDFERLIRATSSLRLFDNFDELLTSSLPEAVNYPPHNIVQLNENEWSLQFALAGLSEKDFKVTQVGSRLNLESVTEQKAIEPEKDDQGTPKKYPMFIKQGLALRSFKLHFDLPQRSTVESATFEDGLLTINVSREPDKKLEPRQIEVKQPKRLGDSGLRLASLA